MSTFNATYIVDINGLPVVDMVGTIHALDDDGTSAPLSVTDTGGVPMATVPVSSAGVNQAFIVEDQTQVIWKSTDGTRSAIIQSLDAMEEKAASAEQTAASALQQVSELLGRIGVPGGIAGLNSEGNVTDANADVVGNDTRRQGAVIWAYGSQSARPTESADVMVLWVAEAAPVNAMAGVDFWLNGGMIQ